MSIAVPQMHTMCWHRGNACGMCHGWGARSDCCTHRHLCDSYVMLPNDRCNAVLPFGKPPPALHTPGDPTQAAYTLGAYLKKLRHLFPNSSIAACNSTPLLA